MNIVTITGEQVKSFPEVLAAIRSPLALPDDWNAEKIYGFLTGVAEPTTVVVTDLQTLKKNLGKDARNLENALLLAEEQNSKFLSVLFVD